MNIDKAKAGDSLVVTPESLQRTTMLQDIKHLLKHVKIGQHYTIDYIGDVFQGEQLHLREFPDELFNPNQFVDASELANDILSKLPPDKSLILLLGGDSLFPQLSSKQIGDISRSETNGGISVKAYAAIQLRLPNSDMEWLDKMIRKANARDTALEIFKALASDTENFTPIQAANTTAEVLATVLDKISIK